MRSRDYTRVSRVQVIYNKLNHFVTLFRNAYCLHHQKLCVEEEEEEEISLATSSVVVPNSDLPLVPGTCNDARAGERQRQGNETASIGDNVVWDDYSKSVATLPSATAQASDRNVQMATEETAPRNRDNEGNSSSRRTTRHSSGRTVPSGRTSVGNKGRRRLKHDLRLAKKGAVMKEKLTRRLYSCAITSAALFKEQLRVCKREVRLLSKLGKLSEKRSNLIISNKKTKKRRSKRKIKSKEATAVADSMTMATSSSPSVDTNMTVAEVAGSSNDGLPSSGMTASIKREVLSFEDATSGSFSGHPENVSVTAVKAFNGGLVTCADDMSVRLFDLTVRYFYFSFNWFNGGYAYRGSRRASCGVL